MDLTANKEVTGWESKLYNISDIFWMRDDAAILDKKFIDALNKSLTEKGMEYPIIITHSHLFKSWIKNPDIFPKPLEVDQPYRCTIGNNRLHWAFNRGYSRIECIYVSSKQEKEEVLKITEMEYCVDF